MALRELLDKHIVNEISWPDNRDMIADPLSKGKTRRNGLNTVFQNGEWVVANEVKIWPTHKP